jgi:hypothetical protein
VRIDTLTYNNIQTQGVRRRMWLRLHSPQHLQQCTTLMLQALRLRERSASRSTLVLGAGACTEIPLAELVRNSDEVVLADVDPASMRQGRDELESPALGKRVRLLTCDISGGVSANLKRLIEQQPWNKLVAQGAKAVFDVAAYCLEQCHVPDSPEIEVLHAGEFGVVVSSLVLSQLFSYPLLDVLDHVQRVAPDYFGEQERHHHYQETAQNFRIRIIQAHLHLLHEVVDEGGVVVLLSDVRGFVFNETGNENDTQHRRSLPVIPRGLIELVREDFTVLEECEWEWITDLPEEGKLGRGYEVKGFVLCSTK